MFQEIQINDFPQIWKVEQAACQIFVDNEEHNSKDLKLRQRRLTTDVKKQVERFIFNNDAQINASITIFVQLQNTFLMSWSSTNH